MELTKEILQTLGAPFPDADLEFLPKASSNGKALALAYIDARAVMNRLDAVVPNDWSFDFDVLSPDGRMVRGKLTVCGVTRCDAGEAGKEEEPLKSAVSDALKRAAVHFNIGRYIYYLPQVWAPYDPQKKRWSERPNISQAAIDHALRACGVSSGRATQPASRPATAPAQDASERKGIWAAGAENRARETAPESSGDRAAATPKPAPSAPTQATLSGTSAPAEKCAKCHAPAGKPHAKSCDQGAQVPGAFR